MIYLSIILEEVIMEEESTFYPHYEIPINIKLPVKPTTKRVRGQAFRMGIPQPFLSPSLQTPIKVLPKAPWIPIGELREWCDDNLGERYYHLGENKVVVYSEENAMAVKLRWC